MLMYDKYTITVKNQTAFLGYIKSVDFSKSSFELTKDAIDAKKYSNIATLNKEIEKISRFPISVNNNYTFDYK